MEYSNPGIAMMTYCVTAALRSAPQKDIRALLRDRVMRPIGVGDADWSVGYGKTFTVDGLPLVASWGGGAFTARAAARIGRLMAREGDWDGKRLLSAASVRATTTDVGTPGPCGVGWWCNTEGSWPVLPRDAYFGSGAGHKILLAVPSLKLIVVRLGGELMDAAHMPTDYHDVYRQLLFEPLMAALEKPAASRVRSSSTKTHQEPRGNGGSALRLTAPYNRSSVITGIQWAPKESIVRRAPGGDNWPMTWADDDALYTSFGDGNGFEPFTPEKLSMGFARVTGGAADFAGVNIRSATGETRGNGPRGKKASGLLSIDGVLYMLARNAGNSQLAWSGDHGLSWTWADWKFTTSFGCPTFLNFGKDYAGARDAFVYIYSPDSDNAYEAADRMVLARVPKEKLRQREAYEFFVRRDEQGMPLWSKNIADRGAVFRHPGRCYRSAVTYDAAIGRYLWVQILPESRHPQGLRFQGGFGVYDAPEPWGPWTTVFFTNDWDVGPGETASFPTKWMSADGRTLAYVFSGNDSFSVRKATLVIAK